MLAASLLHVILTQDQICLKCTIMRNTKNNEITRIKVSRSCVEKKGRCRWQWEEREGSVEGGERTGIQCKGLANLSDLPHCPTLKASASIVSAEAQRFHASRGKLDKEERRTRWRMTESKKRS